MDNNTAAILLIAIVGAVLIAAAYLSQRCPHSWHIRKEASHPLIRENKSVRGYRYMTWLQCQECGDTKIKVKTVAHRR